jgi:hypothetical protein
MQRIQSGWTHGRNKVGFLNGLHNLNGQREVSLSQKSCFGAVKIFKIDTIRSGGNFRSKCRNDRFLRDRPWD